ncbi:glycosyltransferase [Streptomyces sp. NPDC002932]|uniref:glycosyltransferase n=1 Tax=Streptomyces sp. NPDC002932 TaxID=3364672 RepID=UPI0036A0476B
MSWCVTRSTSAPRRGRVARHFLRDRPRARGRGLAAPGSRRRAAARAVIRVRPAAGPRARHAGPAQFIPQKLLLPQCDPVVSHGGSGSLMGALAHGLPSVLLPLGADQPYNARRCVELGAAQVLDAVTVSSEEVRTTVSAVLADVAYRRAIERVGEEISALPGREQTIPLFEALH